MTNSKENNTDPKKATESDTDFEHLDKNEKLAFEKIIGEIEETDKTNPSVDSGQANPEEDAAPKTDSNATDNETQPQEQSGEEQTSLDKITNEINEDSPDDTSDDAPESNDAQPASDELDDDQQAALDKIMNEINGDSPDDTPDDAPESNDAQPASDKLDDDQQAALDKIMNEINGDSPDDTPDDAPESNDAQPASDELDDDQQAALDKIMNEINEDSPDDAPDDAPESNDAQEENQTPEKITLSIEEFDDELNNLLADATTNNELSETPKLSPKEPANDLEKLSEIEVKDHPETSSETPNEPAKEVVQAESTSKTEDEQDYAILHEVKASDKTKTKKTNKRPPKKTSSKKGKNNKKVLQFTVAALVLIGICGTAYWRYNLTDRKSIQMPLLSTASTSDLNPPKQDISEKAIEMQEQAPTVQPLSTMQRTVQANTAPAAPTLNTLMDELNATREHVLSKITEIKELKQFYQNGVDEEYAKIKLAAKTSNISSYQAALRNKSTELGLRAIQRRKVYITKLDTPIKQLSSASEELLFLERKTRIFDALNQGLSDLSIPEFKKEVSEIISNHLKSSNVLSIDHLNVNPPSLESIWNNFQSITVKKEIKPHRPHRAQDNKINQEICNGNYDRKYLLTQLTPESAKCIAQWSGKDLYLNNLSTLPPSMAKAIAQWPGEWLSLNGLKELSQASAKHLSQWKGKRMSLNGLTKLNQKSTRHLSQWNGEQLEMVGLKSIGRWENYGTRLFLSEHLRKKLQIQ